MTIALSLRPLRVAFFNMLTRGPRPLVLCGPSGSGKSTLIQRMCNEFPNTFGFSISHTTRAPRPGEEHGKHYYFTTKEKMQDGISKGEFIETATFNNNMYGTSCLSCAILEFSKQAVENVMNSGRMCVLDIEIEGVKQIKRTTLDPLLVFIKPPSIQQLEKRLKARNTETQESLRRRLAIAVQEIEYGEEPGNFHLTIINDDVEQAYNQLREFILEELKQYNMQDTH